MVQGTWNQEYFTSTNGPSNNDTNSYGNLDVYLGGFVAIGQETTPPHATVNNLVLDNWSPNWQLANNIHIYRPALLGGVINVNSIEALTFPIENVYRIYITARKAKPADGQVENNAVFTLTPTFE